MKKISILIALLAGFTIALNVSCYRQPGLHEYIVTEKRLNAPLNFFDKIEKYYNWQSENILDMASEVLLSYTPQVSEPIVRQMTMLMLDAVLHDMEAPIRPAVQEFHHARTAHALKEMENTNVNKGAKIWKLYDMGFVIRTKTVTVGFDIIRGYSARAEGFAITDSIMNAIVKQCDVLFISHRHRDHSDEWVARAFLDQGKPVITPAGIWEELSLYDEITHLDRKAHKVQLVPIQSGGRDLKVVIYPGNQNATVINNVALIITPEDLTFCHTGDQNFLDDFYWIDEVSKHFQVDVLIPNCWTRDPARTAKGYNPKLIIPGHENELGHTIDHREAYALDYSRWNLPYPKLIMTWGESYDYKP